MWDWRRGRGGGGGGGGDYLVWPIRRCAAGQGMAFYLSGLNMVYDFVRVCSNLGNRVINLSVQRLAYTQNEILVVHIGGSNERQTREDFVNLGFLFPTLFIL